MKPAHVHKLASALPEAIEAPHFHFASYRVRGKIFATLAPGGDVRNVFVGEEERQVALALAPSAVEKLEWGGRVVGVQVKLADARPAMVASLLSQAWSGKAPKSLLALKATAKKS